MGNLNVDTLFTNIPLEETIEICTNTLCKNTERIGLSKIYFLLQNNPFLFLMETSTRKSMESLCVHL